HRQLRGAARARAARLQRHMGRRADRGRPGAGEPERTAADGAGPFRLRLAAPARPDVPRPLSLTEMAARYREGDWFAVPLGDGRYVLGRIARHHRATVLGYFFKPAYDHVPTLDEIGDL